MSDETRTPSATRSQEAIDENPVILFMKGTPEQPMCGFSARTAGGAAGARGAVRGRRHPARPAHPPGAVGAVELADDPAAVRRRRAGRRLPTSSPRCTRAASWPSCSASSSPRRPPEPAAERRGRRRSSIENRLGLSARGVSAAVAGSCDRRPGRGRRRRGGARVCAGTTARRATHGRRSAARRCGKAPARGGRRSAP